MLARIGIALAGIALSGCTLAEFNSINRGFNPEAGDSRLIDAKQRAIYATRRPRFDADGTPITYVDEHGRERTYTDTVVCAEPSPDALQATAAALAGEASSQQVEALVRGSASTGDSGVSIGLRTQAITLLRDAYYRLCEGYSNDAMDDIAFNILQQRFQNHMVALLAVEQLTGATVAAQGAVGTTAAGDAGANISAILQASTSASDRLAALETELADVQAKLDAGSATDEEVLRLKTRKSVLQNQINRGEADLAATRSALADATGVTAGTETSATGTLGSQRASAGGLPSHVSAAVSAITLNTLNQDYGLQLCVELSRNVFTSRSAARLALTPLPGYQNVAQGVSGIPSAAMMINYCTRRLNADASFHEAEANLRRTKSEQVAQVVRHLATHRLSPEQAAAILAALDGVIPDSPATAFQPDFSRLGGSGGGSAAAAPGG